MIFYRQLHLVIMLLLWGRESFSQDSTFNWSDSLFQVGSKRVENIIPLGDASGPCTVNPCYETNKILYDTLIQFLKKHPSISVQIASHVDSGIGSEVDDWFSEREASYFGFVLASKGINSKRITTIGYGSNRRLLKEDHIANLSKREQLHARAVNTRIEIVITSNSFL